MKKTGKSASSKTINTSDDNNKNGNGPPINLGQGGLADEDLDKIVMVYLDKKGYTQTSDVLRKEAGNIPLHEVVYRDSVESATEVNSHILFYNVAENDANVYESSYTKLENWISGSLDKYKVELSLVLFPAFVHCYLGLISKGFIEEGKHFLRRHKKENYAGHEKDLTSLCGVVLPYHIKENQYATNVLNNKFVIDMCSASHDILISFLHDNKMTLLLGIVNQFIKIVVFSGKPVGDEATIGQRNPLPGENDDKVANQRSKTKVLWSTLQEHSRVTERLNIDQDDPRKKISILAGISTKKNPTTPARDRVPLPDKTEEDIQLRIKDIQAISEKVKLSSTSLPSACMYTFFNTNDRLNCCEISNDSSLMVNGFADSHIRLWNLSGKPLREMKRLDDLAPIEQQDSINNQELFYNDDEDEGGVVQGTSEKTLFGHSGAVYAVKFSRNNRFLISGSEDATARLWSLDTYTNLVVYKGHNYPIWDVDYASEGPYFATASHDRTARLYSTQYINPLRIFAGHLSDVDSVKFHPNCNYLATGSSDRTVRLWDIPSGQCVRLFTGHTGSIGALAFSPDGKYLASAGEDKTINIWDISNGKKFGSFKGHENTIYSLDYDMNGSILSSGSHDNTVRLWDTQGLSVNPRPANLQLSVFPTKSTIVMKTHFTHKNILLCAGRFRAGYQQK